MFHNGVYPVMLTPFRNGEVDMAAIEELTNWYIEKGCAGIFAVCQSSEMFYLSLKEKENICRHVVKLCDGKADVVVSGHTSDSI